jgi:hypothetical protein
MSRPNPTGHPARFSDEVVDLFVEIINHEVTDWFNPPTLWDPYAGTGEALGDIARRCIPPGAAAHLPYGGTEIEAEFIVDPHIILGDATYAMNYPPRLTAAGVLEGNGRFVIITSPVYPNGMADSWKMSDASKRYTYQSAKNDLVGVHTELHVNNQGRYGYRGTKRAGPSRRRSEYWRIARESVPHWAPADMVLVNVSDFKHSNGQIEPLVMDWRWLLKEHGWTDIIEHPVATNRMLNGANADQRVEHEVILAAKR